MLAISYLVPPVGVEPTRDNIFVGEEGVEPSSLSAHDFESCVFANFTTHPFIAILCEKERVVNSFRGE